MWDYPSIYEQIWRYMIPSMLEALQFTNSSNAYRWPGAFDKKLQRMSSRSLLNRANTLPFKLTYSPIVVWESDWQRRSRYRFNSLDDACRNHNIGYSHCNDLTELWLTIYSPKRRGNITEWFDSRRESRSRSHLGSYEGKTKILIRALKQRRIARGFFRQRNTSCQFYSIPPLAFLRQGGGSRQGRKR